MLQLGLWKDRLLAGFFPQHGWKKSLRNVDVICSMCSYAHCQHFILFTRLWNAFLVEASGSHIHALCCLWGKKKKDYFSKWIHSTLFGKCAHGQVLFYISLIVNKTPEKAKSINVLSAFLTGWNTRMSECLFTCTWSLPLIIINKYKTWFSFSPLERAREGVGEGKKSDTALHLCVLFMSLKL